MATRKETADFLVEQFGPGASARKMFGEYGLYVDGQIVGLICDERLFVKPLPEVCAYCPEGEMGPPYPGAKDHLVVPEDRWDDQDWMTGLGRTLLAVLPPPKPKKPRKRPL